MVGMPMPRMMPAIAVTIRARKTWLLARSTTTWVNTMPIPVMLIDPITRPAQAQAIATDSAPRAPSSSAAIGVAQVMFLRVSLRSMAIGRQLRAATSAHMGAEYPRISPIRMTNIGMKSCPRTSITCQILGNSSSGTPANRYRLASKCTAKNTDR